MFTPSALLTVLVLAVSADTTVPVQTSATPGTPVTPGTPEVARADASLAASSLRFEPAILDLGEMSVGQTGSGKVTVTNTSDAPITIARIVPACGCTKASAAPIEEVKPGASFDVEFTLDAGKRPGVELKRKVAFHVEGAGVATFELKASIRPDAAHEHGKPFVSLIRLKPASAAAREGRESAEREQDAAILAIDAALERAGAVDGIRMKLHRESGALFVHGTAHQIEVAERTIDDRALGL